MISGVRFEGLGLRLVSDSSVIFTVFLMEVGSNNLCSFLSRS